MTISDIIQALQAFDHLAHKTSLKNSVPTKQK